MNAGAGRLRVLHVIPTLGGGGAERQLALLAEAQGREGHEVHVGLLRLGTHAPVSVRPPCNSTWGSPAGHYDPGPRLLDPAFGAPASSGRIADLAHDDGCGRRPRGACFEDPLGPQRTGLGAGPTPSAGRNGSSAAASGDSLTPWWRISATGLAYWTGIRTRHQIQVVITERARSRSHPRRGAGHRVARSRAGSPTHPVRRPLHRSEECEHANWRLGAG